MNLRNPVQKYGVAAVIAMMAATMAACSNDESSGGSAGTSLQVTAPAANATVTVPFTVTFDSGVPLGDETSGLHHVHLYFDDNSDDYLVVESTTVQVTNAPAGTHVMHLSLRNANHSAAGAETQVALTISAAPGGSPATPTAPASPTPSAAPSDGGSGYSY
jgi:hypothetical protein